MIISEDELRRELKLAEDENSNLRKHLLWAAQYIGEDRRAHLRLRLRNPVEYTGVTRDQAADARAEALRRNAAIEALTDHVQLAVDSGADDAWIARADHMANILRGHMHDVGEITFHELVGD